MTFEIKDRKRQKHGLFEMTVIKIPQQSARVANLHNLDHFLVNKNERRYDWTQCLLKWFNHLRERLSYFDPATLKVFLFFKEKFQYFKIMQNLIRFRPTNQRSFSNRRYSGDQTRLDFLSTLAMIWFFTIVIFLEGKNETVTKSLFYPKQIRVSPFLSIKTTRNENFSSKILHYLLPSRKYLFVVVLV